MNRRALLRTAACIGGALAVEPLIASCADSDGPSARGRGGSDLQPASLVRSDVARRAADDTQLRPTADSVRAFAADLYGRLSGVDGNVICSPYSVAVALAMTRAGALGDTAREMDDVLRALSQSSYNDGMNALSTHLDSLAGPQKRLDGSNAEVALETANSLWGQSDIVWEQPFLDTLAREYGAGMRVVDYIGQREAARRQINAWTAGQTEDRIPEIIPPGVLDEMTRLVLVNAIYLKAPWEAPFEESLTAKGGFVRADGSRVDADMMRGALESVDYARLDGCQVARLPYAGGGLAMTVLLPDGNLASLETGLTGSTGASLGALLRAPRPVASLDLQMPKWKFRVFSGLNDVLSAMGMPTAFDPAKADFEGMTSDADLFIAAVLHDAFIAVDEEGTEAAAATAVVMRDTSAMLPAASLVLDRPFLFVIHDIETSTPLFLGRVGDPTAGPA